MLEDCKDPEAQWRWPSFTVGPSCDDSLAEEHHCLALQVVAADARGDATRRGGSRGDDHRDRRAACSTRHAVHEAGGSYGIASMAHGRQVKAAGGSGQNGWGGMESKRKLTAACSMAHSAREPKAGDDMFALQANLLQQQWKKTRAAHLTMAVVLMLRYSAMLGAPVGPA